MYRQVQHVQERIPDLRRHTHNAILGNDTRQMTREAGAAQVLADELARELGRGMAAPDEFGESRANRDYVQAAQNSFIMAINQAERVGLATNVDELRSVLLDFLTHVDLADAYTRVAVGAEST